MAVEPPPSAAPIRGALDEEIVRLEILVARCGLLVAAVGCALSTVAAVAVSFPLGAPLALLSALVCGWFVLVQQLLRRRTGFRWLLWANPLLEITLPSVLLVVTAVANGPSYALASPLPLQFYAVFTVLAVLRLKPFMPLVVGAVGGLQYALVYLLLIEPAMPAELLTTAQFQPVLILMRSAVVVLGGLVATLVSTAIERAVETASAQIRSTELFGKYRIDATVGSGGMGTVYKATYCPEGGFIRSVAIKRIHPHLAKEKHLVRAFRNEAELTAHLTHPNIVQVLDFGKVEDTYFIAMEFVDGLTLRDMVKRCNELEMRFPARMAGYVALEITEGLHFAHCRARDESGRLLRVVHRDLNPPNILVSRTGDVKILDFGIAKALKDAPSSLTHYQYQGGKAAYMSPEQVRGQGVDERSDLFSLAIILWETLAQRVLFQRGTDYETFKAMLEEPIPRISELRPDIHGYLWDDFFARGLERDVNKRFQSTGEIILALEHILEAEGHPRSHELGVFAVSLMDRHHLPLSVAVTQAAEPAAKPTEG